MEKCYEYNQELFVDYKPAYDYYYNYYYSFRKPVKRAMEKFWVLAKLTRMIRLYFQNVIVKFNGQVSKELPLQ